MNYFLENKYYEIKIIIERNNLIGLKEYIKTNRINLRYYNETSKDILILAILKGAYICLIDFILKECQYESLNYKLGYIECGYEVKINMYEYIPLYISIAKENFELSDLLIKNNADINYNEGIIVKRLFSYGLLTNKKLNYMIKNGLEAKWLLDIFLYNDRVNDTLLNSIFNYTEINSYIINHTRISNDNII
ncbi:hypothetical protein H8356DRAFT_1273280 [Neocallimastix lanati (nom. inval.)]|uniref:Ankyrin n=1 Tax=Neocallimastix californiae TaxID=1754190 RepID=A0A1Y2BSZ8_9FUNG|nr:hypothetical protein H8356DRAFT_1273280 [Neocallimastix sp. JGI-2020a]ORY37866.1 hypothetical protein LY90DRAFT_511095 [Neocallimastix californiae]|eukprot:ORY37866.1 hypothetical protein LY90DRAFT_511095 [Neocallimastix californiae]